MSKIKILWMVILFNISSTFAQNTTQAFKIHFDVDKSNLDNEDIEELNKLLYETKNASYYEIDITAHTDNDADNNYNVILSKKRAKSVEQYLLDHFIPKIQILSQWKGEYKPLNKNITTIDKAENRRVDITFYTYKLNNIDELKAAINDEFEQKFTINPSINQTIIGEKGTKIVFTAGSLVLPNGEIPKGNVDINLMEYQTAKDAILNNLSTISNGKILESGGMFNLTASYNNEQLILKEGKTLNVEMPSQNIKNNMQVFTGKKAENGIIEWDLKNSKFETKNSKINTKNKMVFSKKEILKMLDYDTTLNIEQTPYKILTPKFTQRPKMPRKLRPLVYLIDSTYFNGIQKIMFSKQKRANILQIKNDEKVAIYTKQLNRYNKRLDQYNTNLITYFKDSSSKIQDSINYNNWINTEIQNTQKIIEHYEKINFNFALNRYLLKNKHGDTVDAKVLNYLQYSNNFNLQNFKSIKTQQKYLNHLFWYKNVQFASNYDYYINKDNIYYLYHFKKNKSFLKLEDALISQNKKSTYAQVHMNENTHITSTIRDFKLKDILNKETLNVGDISTIYSANISQLGFINCDRFTQNELVAVKVNFDPNQQVYFSIKSMNTNYCPHNVVENNYFTATMPKNIPVTMVVMGLKNGKPYFEKRVLIFTENGKVDTNPKPSNTQEILKELASL